MIVKIHLNVRGGDLQGLKEVTAMKLERIGAVSVTEIEKKSQTIENPETADFRCVISAVVDATLAQREAVNAAFRREMQDGTVEELEFSRAGMRG